VHVPDGYLDLTTSAAAGVVAAVGVGLRRAGRVLGERQVPFAGLAAAFVFVVQMLNFPVAAGTSGHLIGGALAAILLGPSVGVVVLTVVVVLQALLFADGGVSALGVNVVNMAVISVLVGWLVFRVVVSLARRTAAGVVVGAAVASWASTVAASLGFVAEYSVGGSGQVPASTVLAAMVGVHSLIGVGEGLITASVVATVLAVRPDLVHGARVLGVPRSERVRTDRRAVAAFVVGGVLVTLALVVLVAPHAASDPDGLERVATDHRIAVDSVDSVAAGSPVADYQVAGVADADVGTIVAGALGLAAVFLVGAALLAVAARRARVPGPEEGGLGTGAPAEPGGAVGKGAPVGTGGPVETDAPVGRDGPIGKGAPVGTDAPVGPEAPVGTEAQPR
jgi:cobalt/nickel transport system permease protein